MLPFAIVLLAFPSVRASSQATSDSAGTLANHARVFITDSQAWEIASGNRFKSWERKLKTAGGNLNLNAELEAK